jgi:hypothetical protein
MDNIPNRPTLYLPGLCIACDEVDLGIEHVVEDGGHFTFMMPTCDEATWYWEVEDGENWVVVQTGGEIFSPDPNQHYRLRFLCDQCVYTGFFTAPAEMCAEASPYLNGVTELTGKLSVGDLVSNTATIGEYVIDWYLNGDVSFTSGTVGSGLTGIKFHPFNGVDAIPAESGIYTPRIRWVDIDGERYSCELSEDFYSPDLCGCLEDIEVFPYTCENGSSGTWTHEISYDWEGQPGEYATRSVSFDLDASTTVFGFSLRGFTIVDNVKIYYVDQGVDILIWNMNVGTLGNSTSYTTDPLRYGSATAFRHVYSLSGFIYTPGNKIKYVVTPSVLSPSELRTDWEVTFKCFTAETFIIPEDCNLVNPLSREYDTSFTPDMVYNSTNCRWELTLRVLATQGLPAWWNTNYFTIGSSNVYSNNAYPGTPSATTIDYRWGFNQNKTCSSASTSLTPCNASFIGAATFTKSGSVFTVEFSNPTDYATYKADIQSVLATAALTFVNDPTSHFYYQGVLASVFNFCGDSNIGYPIRWHYNSPYTFDDVNYIFEVDAVTITNGYGTHSCDTTTSCVNTAVNSFNTALAIPDGVYVVTGRRNPAATIVRVNQTVNAVTELSGSWGRSFVASVFNICDIESNGNWCFVSGSGRYQFYIGATRVIIDSVDPENNFTIESRLGPDNCLLTNPAEFTMIYDRVAGVGTWYI